jgi:hypothetical protein
MSGPQFRQRSMLSSEDKDLIKSHVDYYESVGCPFNMRSMVAMAIRLVGNRKSIDPLTSKLANTQLMFLMQ